MPTYFVRERHLPLATATTTFGVLLLIAGFGGTLAGGQRGDRMAKRLREAQFAVSGWSLLVSLGFTCVAVLSPVPADLRTRGFALTTVAIHLFGDAASPGLIGLVSDRIGLTAPVLGAGMLLGVSGLVLLAGRNALDRDAQAVAGPMKT
jgi:hypothetical protein